MESNINALPIGGHKFSGSNAGTSKGHVSPFMMYSNETFPTDYIASLDFCAYLYNLTGQYAEASKRVVSHFITDIEFIDKKGSSEEQDVWRKFMVDELDVFQIMQSLGEDERAYGVGYCRINYPFHRYLCDSRTTGRPKYYSLEIFPREHVTYNWGKCTYTVPDPKQVSMGGKTWDTANKIELTFRDHYSKDKKGISLVMLDPRYCRVNYGTMSKKREVVYQFDPTFLAGIKNNDLFEISQTPKKMLEAVANNVDFRFHDGHVFMFTRPTLTGLSKKGLGIPGPIAHYRELHQLQVYRKINETVAKDFMVPLRMVSPGFGSAGGGTIDPMYAANAAQWQGHMAKIIKKWREEQDSFFAVPMPTQYQELSGTGKNLVTKDLMELQMNTLLNTAGYPAELFHGTLAYQQVPVALRIFERSFHFIYHNFNKFLKWVTDSTRKFLGLPHMDVALQPPTLADDEANRQIIMQLLAGGEVPRDLVLKTVGIKDPVQAFKARLQEDAEFEEARALQEQELQKKMEARTLGAASGAAAGPGGGGEGAQGMQQEAMEKAQAWLTMEEGAKIRDMRATAATKPEIHALAKQYMEEAKADGASAGRQQASQFIQPQ